MRPTFPAHSCLKSANIEFLQDWEPTYVPQRTKALVRFLENGHQHDFMPGLRPPNRTKNRRYTHRRVVRGVFSAKGPDSSFGGVPVGN